MGKKINKNIFLTKTLRRGRKPRIRGDAVATFGSAGKELRKVGKGMGLGRMYNAVITQRKRAEFPHTRDPNIS